MNFKNLIILTKLNRLFTTVHILLITFNITTNKLFSQTISSNRILQQFFLNYNLVKNNLCLALNLGFTMFLWSNPH